MEAEDSNSHLTEWAALIGDRVPDTVLQERREDDGDDDWRVSAG